MISLTKVKEVLGVIKPRQCTLLCIYPTQPGALNLSEVLQQVLDWASTHEMPEPTWMQLDADGVPDRNYKFQTARAKLVALGEHSGIRDLWLNSALPDVDDRFTGWLWAAHLQPDCLCIFVDTSLTKDILGNMRSLASVLLQDAPSHYGFATTIPFYYGPYFWVNGTLFESEEGSLSGREEERLSKWNHARIEARKLGQALGENYLRDVFELNFLTRVHLDLRVGDGTLSQWIEQSSERGKISEMTENLFCWEVPASGLAKAHAVLGRTLHLVCHGGYSVRSGGPYGHKYPY